MEGEGIVRGDRLLEINGLLVSAKSKNDLPKILGNAEKSQIVVLRRKGNPAAHQQLIQSQEYNMRLQHRISYLEEQVKELLENKETPTETNTAEKSPHVTSINITSPPVTPPDHPEVYQRGNFIMTIVGGKPVKKATPIPISSSSVSSASSASSVSSQRNSGDRVEAAPNGQQQQQQHRETTSDARVHYERKQVSSQRHHQQQSHISTPMPNTNVHQQLNGVSRSISASSISINSDMNRRDKERREREKELRREIRDRFIYKSRSGSRLDNIQGMNNNGDHLHVSR